MSDQPNEGNPPNDGGSEAPRGGGAFDRIKEHMASNKIEAALWITRILTIFFTFNFFLPLLGGNPASLYQKVLLSNAATSALRLHQRLPRFQLNREFLGLLFVEDSAHYLFYSLIFLSSTPVTMVLVPVFLFALLHATRYTKTILDLIGPNSMQLIRNLLAKIETNNVNILRFIAVNEIFMMPAIIVMIFTGGASLLLPFIYHKFLTLRYSSRRNPYSRQLFYELRMTAEHLIYKPQCPPFVKNIIQKIIGFIMRLAPVEQVAPPPQQPQQ